MIWWFVLHIVRCNSGNLNGISHFLYILSQFVITLMFQQISYCLFVWNYIFKSVSLKALLAYLVYFATYMKVPISLMLFIFNSVSLLSLFLTTCLKYPLRIVFAKYSLWFEFLSYNMNVFSSKYCFLWSLMMTRL
jgi:hypothetical protein